MPFAAVNNVRLFFESWGAGRPVVVVPGLGADTRLFAPLARQLAATHRVIVFDPRGSGKSDKPRAGYEIAQMADDLRGLIEVLGLDTPDVVGYSMGGRIALSFASGNPDGLRRLVLAATSARTLPVRVFSLRWFVMDVLARVPTPTWIDPQPRYAFEAQRLASAEFDGRSVLDQVTAPTLIVRAARDRIVSRGVVDELRGIPDNRLVELPGGHLSLLIRHSDRLGAAIGDFLNG